LQDNVVPPGREQQGSFNVGFLLCSIVGDGVAGECGIL